MIAIKQDYIAQVKRQHQHWTQATKRLTKLENLASEHAWKGTDKRITDVIIRSLDRSLEKVVEKGKILEARLKAESSGESLREALLELREQYLKAETTIHFYTDALNTRTSPVVSSLLNACDTLCRRSMETILQGCGKEVPYVLTYLNTGVGASILKSNLRLWDGNISPVAAIKITFHNIFRTALLHEGGHEIAHILNWNKELGQALYENLKDKNILAASAYRSWASEISADCFAFVHAGYAAVAGLHNVVAGRPNAVFAFHDGDPHPIAYCRVLLGIKMARSFYGNGPWDELEENFKEDYPIDRFNYPSIPLIKACLSVLPEVVEKCLQKPYKAFKGRSLSAIINPMQVSPIALEQVHRVAEGSLINSHAWINKECLKLLALSGYRMATLEKNVEQEYKKQEEWMMGLGTQSRLN